jgi:hypothetical protein
VNANWIAIVGACSNEKRRKPRPRLSVKRV